MMMKLRMEEISDARHLGDIRVVMMALVVLLISPLTKLSDSEKEEQVQLERKGKW